MNRMVSQDGKPIVVEMPKSMFNERTSLRTILLIPFGNKLSIEQLLLSTNTI